MIERMIEILRITWGSLPCFCTCDDMHSHYEKRVCYRCTTEFHSTTQFLSNTILSFLIHDDFIHTITFLQRNMICDLENH